MCLVSSLQKESSLSLRFLYRYPLLYIPLYRMTFQELFPELFPLPPIIFTPYSTPDGATSSHPHSI